MIVSVNSVNQLIFVMMKYVFFEVETNQMFKWASASEVNKTHS
jgi:hypothetical protein